MALLAVNTMENNIYEVRALSAKLMSYVKTPYAPIPEYVDAFTELVKYPIRVRVTKFSRISSIGNRVDRRYIGALLTYQREEDTCNVKFAEVVLDSEKPHKVQVYALLLSFGRLLTDNITPAPVAESQYYPIYLEYSAELDGHGSKNAETKSIMFALLSVISDNEILAALMQHSNIYQIAERLELPPSAIKTRVLLGVHADQNEEVVTDITPQQTPYISEKPLKQDNKAN